MAAAVRFDLAVPGDVRFGAGRIAELPAALQSLGATRAYVVTGRSTDRADLLRASLAQVKKVLDASGNSLT